MIHHLSRSKGPQGSSYYGDLTWGEHPGSPDKHNKQRIFPSCFQRDVMTEESEGYSVAGFGDEERGPQAQACRWPLEAGKARTHISPRPSQEERCPADT